MKHAAREGSTRRKPEPAQAVTSPVEIAERRRSSAAMAAGPGYLSPAPTGSKETGEGSKGLSRTAEFCTEVGVPPELGFRCF